MDEQVRDWHERDEDEDQFHLTLHGRLGCAQLQLDSLHKSQRQLSLSAYDAITSLVVRDIQTAFLGELTLT
jgi:hypothetical protein